MWGRSLGKQLNLYGNPSVLNISRCTHDISHTHHGISRYGVLMVSPTVLNTPGVLMVSPTVLNTLGVLMIAPRCIEHPSVYSMISPQCKVHSLSYGKVLATPILKSFHCNFRLLFSKLTFRGTLKIQFSPKVAHKGKDKEKITAIYRLWMADNERGREWQWKKEKWKTKITFNTKFQHNNQSVFAWMIIFIGYWFLPNTCTSEICS